MSADPRPSLSESARAALLLDAGVKAALRKLQGCDFCIRGDLCDIVGGDCYTAYCVASALAYSAYLARTPLEGVTLEAPESEVQSWAKILHVRPFVPNVAAQMARDILTLKVHCASLQERIAALIDENTKLKCELDGAMDGAACDLETIRHKTAEVAALTAERDALCAAPTSEQMDGLITVYSRAASCDFHAKLTSHEQFQLHHERCGACVASSLRAVFAARTPPVPEDTKNG